MIILFIKGKKAAKNLPVSMWKAHVPSALPIVAPHHKNIKASFFGPNFTNTFQLVLINY